ncbi:SPFH domain-containing protein [Streptomyces sp. NPDC058612]|uniref:SPFH domain-containing protein n=1 Tax=Streptomyces sp. NPDC058612 TaxID=3346555 RepID=UPI003665F6BA
MNELTYDPVLDHQPLPRWRLTNPLRPPVPGSALVLVPDSGPALTILPGEKVQAARFGSYQSVYTVDLTEHRLTLDIALLSRDATFSFRSKVDVVCRVADPAETVARGIRDMSGALYGYVRRTLREVAREYDVAEFHQAEQALNVALSGFRGDSAVSLRNLHVELLVDEDEVITSGREFRDVVRETRLDGMRRRRHLDLMRDEGVEGIIAEIMEREGPRAALSWIEKGEAEQREARLQALRMVLDRGDAEREPFEQAELERAMIAGMVGSDDRLPGGARRGRLRGALSAGRVPLLPEPAPKEAGGRLLPDGGGTRLGTPDPAVRREPGSTPLYEPIVPPPIAPPDDEPVPRTAPTGSPASAGTARPSAHSPGTTGAQGGSTSSRLSGSARPAATRRSSGEAASTAEQPSRVSRVRGTAKHQHGTEGGEPT